VIYLYAAALVLAAAGAPQAPKQKPMTAQELREFYAANKDAPVPKIRVGSAAPLQERNSAAVQKTITDHQTAFQSCINEELKKNPKFKGGRVHLLATLTSQGSVTRPKIDRREVDLSELGRCLKKQARKMNFPAATDEWELEIPLILTSG
jgi:hypothetical protein